MIEIRLYDYKAECFASRKIMIIIVVLIVEYYVLLTNKFKTLLMETEGGKVATKRQVYVCTRLSCIISLILSKVSVP